MTPILNKVYYKYFAKDKILRHYAQHLMVALIALPFIFSITKNLNKNNLIIYIISTFLIDIDGLAFVLFNNKNNVWAKDITKLLKTGDLFNGGIFAVTNHKKLVGLYVHNIVGFIAVTTIFIFSIIKGYTPLSYCAGAILAHFIFDILDDWYNLGHTKNWFWLFKKKR